VELNPTVSTGKSVCELTSLEVKGYLLSVSFKAFWHFIPSKNLLNNDLYPTRCSGMKKHNGKSFGAFYKTTLPVAYPA